MGLYNRGLRGSSGGVYAEQFGKHSDSSISQVSRQLTLASQPPIFWGGAGSSTSDIFPSDASTADIGYPQIATLI